jgi:hypothetical protein
MKLLCALLFLAGWVFPQTKGPPRVERPGQHFTEACRSAQVLRCVGFDGPIQRGGYSDPGQDADSDSRGGYDNAVIDYSTKVSGEGSLRFIVPPFASADSSGTVHFNFSSDLSRFVGEGQEFFVQWRQKMDENYLSNMYLAGRGCPPPDGTPRTTLAACPGDSLNAGMKQIIIGPQDTDSRPLQFGKHWSCETPHLVVTLPYTRAPIMYHSCLVYQNFAPAYVRPGASFPSYVTQSAVSCPYTGVLGKPAPDPCVKYVADEWMTLQMHVKVGQWHVTNDHNSRRDSLVELWIARENQPSVLVQSMVFYMLRNEGRDTSPNQPGAPYKYGKVWLLPYNTGRDPNAGPYPVANVWYDDVIISTARIPDPGVTIQPPTNLTADAAAYPAVALQWQQNSDRFSREAGFEVERCAGQMYDCTAGPLAGFTWTRIAKVAPGVTTYTDNAPPGQIFTYRVRAADASQSSAYSSAVVNVPMPPSGLKVVSTPAGSARLTWLDNSDSETHFAIERCDGIFQYYRKNGLVGQQFDSERCLNATLEEGGKETETFKELGRVPGIRGTGDVAEYEDTTAILGRPYTYRVRALNPAGSLRLWNSTRTAYTGNITLQPAAQQ